jgi:hypothetical protein
MSVVGISWYLCVLSLISAIVLSAITVHPGAQSRARLDIAVAATLAILFAAAALAFKKRGVPGPKWLLRVFQCLAVLGTVFVALMIGG